MYFSGLHLDLIDEVIPGVVYMQVLQMRHVLSVSVPCVIARIVVG